MDVTEFPYSPFHGNSVKFYFDSNWDSSFENYKSFEGSLGVFHFSYGSDEEPAEEEPQKGKPKEVLPSSDPLTYFPETFFNPDSPLPDMSNVSKFKSTLGEKLESYTKTDKGFLMLESVVGLGKKMEFVSTDLSTVAATVAASLSANKLKNAVLMAREFDEHYVELLLTHLLVYLCEDNRFKKDNKNEAFLEKVVVLNPKGKDFSNMDKKVKVLAESVNMARELVSAPPNFANTVTVSEFLKKKLTALGLKVQVLDFDDCKKLGMFCYLSVGQGSKYPPKFLHATYKPDGPVAKTLVFVGKGIMFDSGGYNVKNSTSLIHFMKFDMGGLSAVFAAANAVGHLKPKNVQVHFVSAACENMLDANSYRPGDVVKASDGKTVEVLNTDAEGRVTLADALLYACKLDPDVLVDLATLTGAQMVALGTKCAAYYSNDENAAELYQKAASLAGELVWRMPLLKEYKEFLKSKVADLANVNFNGKAGSVNAALFLKEFVGKKKWVHVDMAGPVYDYKTDRGTGYGVLSLVNFVFLFS